MSQLGEMSNDEFDAFFVVDTDSCIDPSLVVLIPIIGIFAVPRRLTSRG